MKKVFVSLITIIVGLSLSAKDIYQFRIPQRIDSRLQWYEVNYDETQIKVIFQCFLAEDLEKINKPVKNVFVANDGSVVFTDINDNKIVSLYFSSDGRCIILGFLDTADNGQKEFKIHKLESSGKVSDEKTIEIFNYLKRNASKNRPSLAKLPGKAVSNTNSKSSNSNPNRQNKQQIIQKSQNRQSTSVKAPTVQRVRNRQSKTVNKAETYNQKIPVMDFFEYPCGDRSLSWNMDFLQAKKAVGPYALKVEPPMRYFSNKDSEAEIYLGGDEPIDFGSNDFNAYLLNGHLIYRGRSIGQLEYTDANVSICFYRPNENYIKGQKLTDYMSEHSRYTEPGEVAYKYLLEKLKQSGAKILKWKFDSKERVKSCKAIYKGRDFLIMLRKNFTGYSPYFIMISTASYYTEKTK